MEWRAFVFSQIVYEWSAAINKSMWNCTVRRARANGTHHLEGEDIKNDYWYFYIVQSLRNRIHTTAMLWNWHLHTDIMLHILVLRHKL
jgi:hypothetical protein